MSAISEREKLRVLLYHWVAHNKEHTEEYQKWGVRQEPEEKSRGGASRH